jgi:hypothetical protein
MLQSSVFGKTQFGNPIRGSSISKNCKPMLISLYKDLGIFFHCYLLSTVRKKIYRNLPWWKEILTIQNS